MTESKHTPGPWAKADRLNGPWWHISSDHTIGGEKCRSGRQAVACVHGESKKGSVAYSEMFEANARLIAAAPELLERLHALEVAANSAAYCYNNRPEGFAAALQNLNDEAVAARELQNRIKGD